MTKSTGTYLGNDALAQNGFTNTVTTDNHITYAGSDIVRISSPSGAWSIL